jgi:hypothetical protein
MKTATLPSLRVEPELRAAIESLLREGETLSAFVENSVRAQVNFRRTQDEFMVRALISYGEAQQAGLYYTPEEVLGELKIMLEAKRAQRAPSDPTS